MSVDLAALLPSWKLALTADRKSPQTIDAYTTGVRLFLAWCAEQGHAAVLERHLVRGWVTDLLASRCGARHRPDPPDGPQAVQRVAGRGGPDRRRPAA